MIDDSNAGLRSCDKPGKSFARVIRTDNQPLRHRRQRRFRRAIVVFEKVPEAGDDIGLIAEYEEIAGTLEALPGEIQRADERRSVVRDKILRVILHNRTHIGLNIRSEASQERAKVFEPPFPSSRPARHEHADRYVSLHGRCDFVEDCEIVASKERKNQTALCRPHQLQHRIASCRRRENEPFHYCVPGGMYVIPGTSRPAATLERILRSRVKNNSIPYNGTFDLTKTKPPSDARVSV